MKKLIFVFLISLLFSCSDDPVSPVEPETVITCLSGDITSLPIQFSISSNLDIKEISINENVIKFNYDEGIYYVSSQILVNSIRINYTNGNSSYHIYTYEIGYMY